MFKINDGGAAFPIPAGGAMDDGLSMRDYFAAGAIYGSAGQLSEPCPLSAAQIAQWAYELADAMILERDKK